MESTELNLICVYLPETALAAVKQAMFAAGAGQFSGYDHCCWQTPGQGQFRPLPGSNPNIGQIEEVTVIAEYKLEMICKQDCLQACIQALKASHPYEVPAYQVIPFQNFD